MDVASVLGLAIGLFAIVGGNIIEGGHTGSLVQGTALLIVLGGTLGATMVQHPLPVFLGGVKALKTVFFYKERDVGKIIDEIAEYATKARREGIIALESVVANASHPFLERALTMAVDGVDSKSMRDNLELVLNHLEEEGEMPAKVWEAAGGYSPTIGIIGAVMGLIHVMQNLQDVGAVGSGIAVAFVATIYGVALANLFFLPASGKLKQRHKKEMAHLTLMLEGALGIQEGQNPSVIRQKLEGFHAAQKKQTAAAVAATGPATA